MADWIEQQFDRKEKKGYSEDLAFKFLFGPIIPFQIENYNLIIQVQVHLWLENSF